MRVKIINLSDNPLPSYQTEHSAGVDLVAFIDNPIILEPLERCLVPTGLSMELPLGYEAQVRPRSGLALSRGISLINTPGTIDSDYRGEIKVIVVNLSNKKVSIQPKERIAQIVIAKHERVEWTEVQTLSKTERDIGGFGSTGSK